MSGRDRPRVLFLGEELARRAADEFNGIARRLGSPLLAAAMAAGGELIEAELLAARAVVVVGDEELERLVRDRFPGPAASADFWQVKPEAIPSAV